MAFEFRLPDIGEGVAEAEIVKWLVSEGEVVVEDQPLVEVLTDKATVEIPSPRAGTIEKLGAAEGATVPVGSVLVTIAEAAGPTATAPARAEAVPAARMLAKERGLDLATVTGSGPNGRITLDDVKRALESGSVPAAGASPAAASASSEERVPLRGLRRKIAEHMTLAARTVPQFTFVAEVDMSTVVAARKAARAAAEAAGIKLTYIAYIVRALIPALQAWPLLNASLDDAAGEIVLKKHYDIGLATATDEGLTVPVIKDADRLNLFDLARAIERLAQGARERRLKPEEMTGGTFTVTSTGAYGGLLATPIVHHPQVAILGVHAVTPRPVVRDGAIVVREMTNLSLSLDHRVVDGEVGAKFLYDVIARLEQPDAPALHVRAGRGARP